MCEVLNTFKWKPNPKFQWNLINFEKPQNFQKTPNPRFQNMKCMNEKGLEAYQVKKMWKTLENPWVFGRETKKYRERDQRKWDLVHVRPLYRKASKSRQMQVLTGIEVSVEEVSRKYSSIVEVSRWYWGSTHQFL